MQYHRVFSEKISLFRNARIYNILLLIWLAVLGSHFLDYHLSLLVICALFFVNWKEIKHISVVLLTLFLLSVYITWAFLDPNIIHKSDLAIDLFSRGTLIWIMYLMGRSLSTVWQKHQLISGKKLFYILFGVAISYTLIVLISYFSLHQDNPLTGIGMYVLFPNPYKTTGVNDGRLISTILAYYLTLMSTLFPLILFFFGRFKAKGFYVFELLLLLLLSGSSLYLAMLMGRRTTLLLFIVVSLLLGIIALQYWFKRSKYTGKSLFAVLATGMLLFGSYHYYQQYKPPVQLHGFVIISNTVVPVATSNTSKKTTLQTLPAIRKLTQNGIHDKRFSWWSKALATILEYPFGGGHGVYLAPGMRLAHNTWIDIGKDFGMIPFSLFIGMTLLFLYDLYCILRSKNVENLLKYQLLIFAIVTLSIMMIEPVFTSDKTFFAYILFYWGLVSKLHDNIKA